MEKHTKTNLERILYIDDLHCNLIIFNHMFKNDYDITCESNPIQALELLKSGKFDIVVSDCEMPYLNGIELLEKIKIHYPGIIRILLTSHFEYEFKQKDKNRCDCKILTKPISKNDLESTLSEYKYKSNFSIK